MLKLYDSAITFSEFPDEITLCLNISNCPGMCEHCSEPWLLEDVGDELNEEVIDNLLLSHPDITMVGLMGGDSDHQDCMRITDYIHSKGLKVGMYSGREFINLDLAAKLDAYKIGRWIMPKGDVKDWHRTNCGVLQFPWSNQIYFERQGNTLVNATYKFRTKSINNPERFIINSGDN